MDKKTLTAEHRFEVVRRDLESHDLLANFELLKRMAAASGGRFRPLAKLDELLGELHPKAQPTEVVEPRHDELSDRFRWPILAVLVTALCLEWSLRKRRGLV